MLSLKYTNHQSKTQLIYKLRQQPSHQNKMLVVNVSLNHCYVHSCTFYHINVSSICFISPLHNIFLT